MVSQPLKTHALPEDELSNQDVARCLDAAGLADIVRHLRSMCWDAWKLHTLAFAKVNEKIDVSSPHKLDEATHEELQRRWDREKSKCVVM